MNELCTACVCTGSCKRHYSLSKSHFSNSVAIEMIEQISDDLFKESYEEQATVQVLKVQARVIHEYCKYLTKECGEGEFITEEQFHDLMLIVSPSIFHNNFNGYLSFISF